MEAGAHHSIREWLDQRTDIGTEVAQRVDPAPFGHNELREPLDVAGTSETCRLGSGTSW